MRAELGPDEYTIYQAVTAYINEFLPRATGHRKDSVALGRTVFQRRFAGSTHVVREPGAAPVMVRNPAKREGVSLPARSYIGSPVVHAHNPS